MNFLQFGGIINLTNHNLGGLKMRDNQTKSTILYNLRKNKIMSLPDLMEISTGKDTFQDNSGDAIFLK